MNMTIFVSSDGIDANPGTIDMPHATLEAARDVIRNYRSTAGAQVDEVTVYI